MKRLFPLLLTIALLAACKGKEKAAAKADPHAGHAAAAANIMTGVVLETMDVSSYTYVRLKTDQEEVWAAAPVTKVKTGDTVVISDPMLMVNHESKSLKRTFEKIFFAGSLTSKAEWASGRQQMGAGHGAQGGGHPKVEAPDMEIGKIGKAAGGVTVGEIFKDRMKFEGKAITVRGRVVKANYGIMNKTWLHVRDGTGQEGGNDLTVTTTEETPKAGDIVTVSGVFAGEKDFGMGYRYPGIVENAQVTVEKQ